MNSIQDSLFSSVCIRKTSLFRMKRGQEAIEFILKKENVIVEVDPLLMSILAKQVCKTIIE